jgi:DNA-binding response OmpR family regulator
MAQKILLIDDDPLLCRALGYTLERAGYEVSTAGNARDGLAQAEAFRPDLVLLDIGLPGMDGLDALQIFRKQRRLPVILLTARRGESDEAAGLELGADDYVKKPYNTGVLLARIRNALNRNSAGPLTAPGAVVTVGDLRIDPQARTAKVGTTELDLTPRAFDVLYLLAKQAGKVVPHATLLAEIWGRDFDGEPQVLYVHIRWLREKLQHLRDCKVQIVTVHRAGYKLIVEEC